MESNGIQLSQLVPVRSSSAADDHVAAREKLGVANAALSNLSGRIYDTAGLNALNLPASYPMIRTACNSIVIDSGNAYEAVSSASKTIADADDDENLDNLLGSDDEDAEILLNDAGDNTPRTPDGGGGGDADGNSGSTKQRKRPAKDPFMFGKCQVCGLVANGVHYGVESCEGCKGFYRRSVRIYTKFKCKGDGTCFGSVPLKCRQCRFRRCVQLGMQFNSTRMGRIPKHIKTHATKLPAAIPVTKSSSATFALPQQHCKATTLNRTASANNHHPPTIATNVTSSSAVSSSVRQPVPATEPNPLYLQQLVGNVLVKRDETGVNAAGNPSGNISAAATNLALLAVANSLQGKRLTAQPPPSGSMPSSSFALNSSSPAPPVAEPYYMPPISVYSPPNITTITVPSQAVHDRHSTFPYNTTTTNSAATYELPAANTRNNSMGILNNSITQQLMLLGLTPIRVHNPPTPMSSEVALRADEIPANVMPLPNQRQQAQQDSLHQRNPMPSNLLVLSANQAPTSVAEFATRQAGNASEDASTLLRTQQFNRSAVFEAALSSLTASISTSSCSAGGENRELEIIAQIRRIVEASIAASSAAQYPTLDYTTKVATTNAGFVFEPTSANQQPLLSTDGEVVNMDLIGNDASLADVGDKLASSSSKPEVQSSTYDSTSSSSNIGLDHLSLTDSGSTDNEQQQQQLLASRISAADQIHTRRSADAVLQGPKTDAAAISVSRAASADAAFTRHASGTTRNSPAAVTKPTTNEVSAMDKVYDGVLAFLRESATTVIEDPLRVYAYVVVEASERTLFLPLYNQTTIISLFTPEGTAQLHQTTRDIGKFLNLVDPLKLAWTTLLLGLRYAARKYFVNKLFLDCLQSGLPLRKWQQTPSDLNEGVCVVAAHFCQRMADFVDSMPGICRLPADDRRVLTRSSMVLGWASFKALMFERNDSYLLLGNGARYNVEWMEYLIGADVAGIICRACTDMKSMRLTFAEMCLFTSIMILYEKQVGITAPDAVFQLRQHYWRALEHLVQSTQTAEQARQKLEHVHHCLLYCDDLCNTCLPRIESYSFDRPFSRRDVPLVESEQFIDIVEKGPI